MSLSDLKKTWSWIVRDDSTIEITGYKGLDSVVEIPAEIQGKVVTGIGPNAFSPHKGRLRADRKNYLENGLKEVRFPDGLKSIGWLSFAGCAQLDNLNIPDSVKQIEDAAFSGCTSLRHICLPKKLRKIKSSVFSGCTAIEELCLPNSVKSIEGWAFMNCIKLKKLYIKDATVHSNTFENCHQLTIFCNPNGDLASYAAKVGIPCLPFEEPSQQGSPLAADSVSDIADMYPEDSEPTGFFECEICGTIFGVLHIPLSEDETKSVCLCDNCATGGVNPAKWWKCPDCKYNDSGCPVIEEFGNVVDGVKTESKLLRANRIGTSSYLLECIEGKYKYLVDRLEQIHAAIPCACNELLEHEWYWNGGYTNHSPMWCWEIDGENVKYCCALCGAEKTLTLNDAICSEPVQYEDRIYTVSTEGDINWKCPVHGCVESGLERVKGMLKKAVQQRGYFAPCCIENLSALEGK